jgi:hypothetical protein
VKLLGYQRNILGEKKMSLQIAKFPALQASAAIQVLNQLRLDLLRLANGSVYHANPSTAIPEFSFGSFGVSQDLLNTMAGSFNQHLISVCDATGEGCHLAPDYDDEIVSPLATDGYSGFYRANELKRKFNQHIASSEFHAVEDLSHVVTAPDATDTISLAKLTIELRNKMNGHFAGAFLSPTIKVIDP